VGSDAAAQAHPNSRPVRALAHAPRPPAPLGQPNFTAAQSHPHTKTDHSRNGGEASIASHGPQMGNGGRASTGGEASIASHGPQMGNGGRVGGQASNESHGLQMGNGGRAKGGTGGPGLPGGPCLNCGARVSSKWCGGGGRGSKLQGKICYFCWNAGFRVPGPPAAGLITSFFPSKKE
jgi:hypothetical protein